MKTTIFPVVVWLGFGLLPVPSPPLPIKYIGRKKERLRRKDKEVL
jgi:hypothetical protein